MQQTISAAQWVFGLAVLPYALAVLMPSWRWLLGCVVLVGGALLALWVEHWIAASAPTYKERVSDAIGIAIFACVTLGFVAGVITRIITLILAARERSLLARVTVSSVGLPLAIGLILVPDALRAWRLRPPSEACANAVFRLDVAGAQLMLPPSGLFNVYLGGTSASDAYYLWDNESVRRLCAITSDGAKPVAATHIWLNIAQNHSLRDLTCERLPGAWRARFCPALMLIQNGRVNETDYPVKAHVFASEAVKLGGFGATRSTYEDSRSGRGRFSQATFVTTERLTPDGTPLTFECMESSGGRYCRAAYAWVGGAHLQYEFHADTPAVVEKGLRVDETTRAAFEALLSTP